MVLKFLNFFRKKYETLNKIEVSQVNLLHNYLYLASLNKKVNPSTTLRVDGERSRTIKIAPVIKSNAYGHGISLVAKILDSLYTSDVSSRPPFFCVDSLYEAYQLQKAKIKTPILVMGYTDPENFKVKKLPFSYAIFDLETARVLNKYQSGCGVHIFVDTGMHREGISFNELSHFLQEIKKLNNLKIEGLMSHLASADDKKDSLNKTQIKNFKKALEICKKNGIHPKWTHLSNSDGLLNHIPTSDVGVQNVARSGLALYGISKDPHLKPALTLKSKIIQIKKLKRGDRVGYGGTYIAKRNMDIGILPIGYYDGVDRRLSNNGIMLIDGIKCPIIGRVSMNITTIDISQVPDPTIGEEVFVYSNNRNDRNSIENTAKLCKTIPYDILIGLAASTKRVVV